MAKERLNAIIRTLKDHYKKFNWTKKKRIAVIVSFMAVIFVLFFIGRNGGNAGDSMTIRAQAYQEKIVAVGQLQLAKETTLVSEVSGQVSLVGAEVGSVITAGAVIISIDDADLDFQMEQKKAAFENADAQYKHLIAFEYASAKEDLKSAESKKEETRKAYEAAVQLFQEGAVSETDYLEYKADFDAAMAAWNTAELKLQSLEAGGSLRNSSYSQLLSAQASYESAVSDQKKYHITVPWDSVFLKTYVNEQDYVQTGDPLAEIGEAGSYHVVAELDEKYFPYLTKGMEAMISLGDAGNGSGMKGEVETVTPKIDSDTGTFEIKIALPSDFPYQASDLTVNVEIVLKENKNAIVIPEQYLINKEAFVYLYRNGKAVKTAVEFETGPSSQLQITDGLKEGDIIIKPTNSIRDGEEVKISKEDGAV